MKTKLFLTAMIISMFTTSLLNAQNISLYTLSNFNPDSIPSNVTYLFNKLDAFSGTYNLIDTLTSIKSYSLGSATFDHGNNNYIFTGNDTTSLDSKIFVVDSTGNIVSDMIIPSNQFLFEFNYDLQNQQLYAFENDTSGNNLSFISIDINFNINQINFLNNEIDGISTGSSCFDSNFHKIFFTGTDINSNRRLYCLNSQNGSIENNPLINHCYLRELEYDDKQNKLYGIYKDTANLSSFNFVQIDITNANVSILNPLNEISSISTGSSVFDQNTEKYIFIGVDTSSIKRIFIVDVQSGQIISNAQINNEVVGGLQCSNTLFAKEFYTHIQEEKPLFNDLSVYPNPAKDNFNLEFTVADPQDVNIRVVNNIGQVIYQDTHKNYQGKYSGKIDTHSFATGVYVLNIKVGENTQTQDITVLH